MRSSKKDINRTFCSESTHPQRATVSDGLPRKCDNKNLLLAVRPGGVHTMDDSSDDDSCLIASEEEEEEDSDAAAEAWGAAVRARLSGRVEEADKQTQATARQTLANVSQDADFLWALMEQRAEALVDDCGVVTTPRMRLFACVAGVCKAWREAVCHVVTRKCVLRPSGAPFSGLLHPTFVHAFAATAPKGLVCVAAEHQLHLVDVCTGSRSTIGQGGSEPGEFWYPHGITASATALYVADRSNHRIQKLRLDGTPLTACTTVKPVPVSPPAALGGAAENGFWEGLDFGPTHGGEADDGEPEGSGGASEGLARRGSGIGRLALWGPYGLALGEAVGDAQLLYASDSNNDRVVAFESENLRFRFAFPGGGVADLDRPRGLAVCNGEVFCADFGNNRVAIFRAADGVFLRELGSCSRNSVCIERPYGVVAAHGMLYVSEWAAKRVAVFTLDGVLLQLVEPVGCGHLGGLSADADMMYVVDCDRDAIHVLCRCDADRKQLPALATESARRHRCTAPAGFSVWSPRGTCGTHVAADEVECRAPATRPAVSTAQPPAAAAATRPGGSRPRYFAREAEIESEIDYEIEAMIAEDAAEALQAESEAEAMIAEELAFTSSWSASTSAPSASGSIGSRTLSAMGAGVGGGRVDAQHSFTGTPPSWRTYCR